MKRIILSVLAFIPFITFAGGFQLNVQALRAIGMGGASTAVENQVSSAYFNPAALTTLEGHNFSFGINIVDAHVSLQTAQNANIDQTTGIGTPFHFYYSGSLMSEKFEDKLKVGFLVNNQFGSSASFDDEWQGRNVIQNISLKTFMFQPTLAYKFNDYLSLGGGFVFTTGSFSTEKAVPLGSATSTEGKAHLEGSGTAMGYNIGIYSQFLTLGEEGSQTKLAVGMDYRSKLAMELAGGDATFTGIPTSVQGTFPAATKFDSKITLPSVFTFGFSVKHIKENWELEFLYDFNLTGWSSYDSLNFDFENVNTPDSRAHQNWNDVLTHRFGLEYKHKEKISVRLGAYYDNTPMDDNKVSPHLPGISQLAYTFGLGYQINEKFSVDFSFIKQDAEAEKSLDYANFSAKYHRIVNVYSFGINYKL